MKKSYLKAKMTSEYCGLNDHGAEGQKIQHMFGTQGRMTLSHESLIANRVLKPVDSERHARPVIASDVARPYVELGNAYHAVQEMECRVNGTLVQPEGGARSFIDLEPWMKTVNRTLEPMRVTIQVTFPGHAEEGVMWDTFIFYLARKNAPLYPIDEPAPEYDYVLRYEGMTGTVAKSDLYTARARMSLYVEGLPGIVYGRGVGRLVVTRSFAGTTVFEREIMEEGEWYVDLTATFREMRRVGPLLVAFNGERFFCALSS
jgi:hypothetical protein